MAAKDVALGALWVASAIQVFSDTFVACLTTWNGLPNTDGSGGSGKSGVDTSTGFTRAATGGKVGNDPGSIAGGALSTLTSVPFSNAWFNSAQKTGAAIASGIVPQWAKDANTALGNFFKGLLP
jgi:hypothetical protein